MDHVLTLAEVAALLRTSPDTLRYWRHIGTGPRSGKIGRRVVYRESDVMTFLDEQLGASDPNPAA